MNQTEKIKKVAIVSQQLYFDSMYGDTLGDSYILKKFPLEFSLNKYSDLLKFDPEYIFFFRGEYIPIDLLEKLDGIKIAISSEPFPRFVNKRWFFTLDSLRRYAEFRNIRKRKFDYVFHYDKHSLPLFILDNMNFAGEFILPVNFEKYHPSKIKIIKDKDLFFVGRSTKHRENLFDLSKHHLNFLHIAHGIHGDELVDLLHRSKICINAHAEDEISWEPRLQMMLACNSFVLSEKILKNDYLIPGKHYVEYTDNNDLLSKAKYYLEHDEEREKIAKAGYEQVKSFFCAKNNILQLLSNIENGIYSQFQVGKDKVQDFYTQASHKEGDYLKDLNVLLSEQLTYSEGDKMQLSIEKLGLSFKNYLNIRNSKSFLLGDLFFRSFLHPYKIITFPINFLTILLKKK